MGKANVQHIDSNLGFKTWNLSKDQKKLKNIMIDNDIVFVTGKAGCGKTGGVLHHYVEQYLDDKTKKIVVIRTPVEAGIDKIGALPSGLSEKIEPHFMPAKRVLGELLTPNKVECDLGKRIEFKIPNFCLGDTFNDSLVIISEAQQIPPMILKLLLERIGARSKCVIEGDSTQLYANDGKRNGLNHAVNVFFDDAGECAFSNKIALFNFTNEVNQRSEIVKEVNDAYSSVGM